MSAISSPIDGALPFQPVASATLRERDGPGVATSAQQLVGNDPATSGGTTSVTNSASPTAIPVVGWSNLTSIGNLMVNPAGYLTTTSGQAVLGYAATKANDGTYAPNLAGGMNSPIYIPPGSTHLTIGAGGSVNYQTPTGTTVTAGYFSLGAMDVGKAGTQDSEHSAGSNVPEAATSTPSVPSGLASMIEDATRVAFDAIRGLTAGAASNDAAGSIETKRS